LNLVLFEPADLSAPLPLADPRAQHILKVLRRAPGDTFVAGLVDGPLGTATLLSIDDASATLLLSFTPAHEPPPLPPLTLLVGLPRPQTARDLLRDATTLGVSSIHFVATERADPNYAASTLWTSGEWRRHLLVGAAQACDTRLPAVTWKHTLASVLSSSPLPPSPLLLALDNYEATTPLASALASSPPGQIVNHKSQIINPVALALGPERGWGPADRASLRAAGFTLCSLGPRVVRLETAVTAGLSLLLYGRSTTF
jgi:16S rRNA (uracil1498-N3)-methyltransferase